MSSPTADAVDLARSLIRCPSVTPADAGALDVLSARLAAAGFATERLRFEDTDTPAIDNLYATIGSGAPHLMLTGHTDVVPPGDSAGWRFDPFAARLDGDRLYGRGAVDMKGGLACLVAAATHFVAAGMPETGTISFLVTGDEEGPAINGTRKLLDWAKARDIRFDAAVLAEPTSRQAIGDTIKIGRRGSLSGQIVVTGTQGHVAYPHLARSPMPILARLLDALCRLKLDAGNAHFEPSSLQLTSVDTGNPAYNVIPARVEARFNIRHSTEHTADSLRALVEATVAEAAGGDHDMVRVIFLPNPSPAFLTEPGPLVEVMARAVTEITGLTPDRTTGGGTSDARFIKDHCPVLEIGLLGQTMHQVDENTPLADLATLTDIFSVFLDRFFRDGHARS